MPFELYGARHLVCRLVCRLALIAVASSPTGVLAANRAPSISGTPSELALSGADYSFQPTASDPDGNRLKFWINNRPQWASFSWRDGRLYGTPGPEHVGRYENILIAVSDGRRTTRLPVFAIEVVATALGTMTVSWIPATEREDGSPLTDLGGHKLYWGAAEGDYRNVVVIDNPGITIYVIEGIVPGTYYLAASTLDGAGMESVLTPPVQVTVP